MTPRQQSGERLCRRSECIPERRLWAGPISLRQTLWIGSTEGNAGARWMLTRR